MAFLGSLKTFSITDLFSCIHQLRKTGVLTFVSESDERSFLFLKGDLVYASARDGTRRMGSYFVRLGLITQDQLQSVLARTSVGEAYLGQKVLEMQILEGKDVHAAVQTQILDILGEVLTWGLAAFHFDEAEVPFSLPDGAPLPTPIVLLEAARRADERNRVKELFPDLRAVFERTGAPGASAELDSLLSLVDGERDVEEVLFQSPEGQMTAAHHLADALARGLVRPSQVQGNSLLERSAADFLRLPVAPHVPGMLFSIFNADAHVIRRTAEVMAEDPVLTARALKGLSLNNTEVPRNKLALQSIAELLGGPQLRSILIPEAVRGLFFSRPHSFWREGWEHSVACARWSRWLAGLIEYPFPEEAYLAGLLHNFGAFLLVNHNHQLYTRIIQESYDRKVDIQALEESAFGTCHTRLGSQLAEKWGFPKALSTVIEAHHGAEESAGNPLLNIVVAACSLIREPGTQIGYAASDARQQKAALKKLRLNPRKVLSLADRLDQSQVVASV